MDRLTWKKFFEVLAFVVVFAVPVILYLMEKAGTSLVWIFVLGWISIAAAALYLFLSIPWVWADLPIAVRIWRISLMSAIALLIVGYGAIKIWPNNSSKPSAEPSEPHEAGREKNADTPNKLPQQGSNEIHGTTDKVEIKSQHHGTADELSAKVKHQKSKMSNVEPASEQTVHPVIGMVSSSVMKDAILRQIKIVMRLQNTSSFETTVHVAMISTWNGAIIYPINDPRDYAFTAQAWVDVTLPIYLSEQDEVAFVDGTGSLRIRLTAEYPDSGRQTVFVLEGRVDPKLDAIDVTKSVWSH